MEDNRKMDDNLPLSGREREIEFLLSFVQFSGMRGLVSRGERERGTEGMGE